MFTFRLYLNRCVSVIDKECNKFRKFLSISKGRFVFHFDFFVVLSVILVLMPFFLEAKFPCLGARPDDQLN